MVSQLSRYKDVAVVIPAYNEGPQVKDSIKEVLRHFENVFVVDDGSTDSTSASLSGLEITYIRHPINLGQGAALQTGIICALQNIKIDYFLTFDADGQHSLDSAIEMVNKIKNIKTDVILGSRFIEPLNNIPKKKKFILKLGIAYSRIDSGLKVTDTHNGLRVMSRKFAQSLSIKKHGMAHASEILNHIKAGKFTWEEFPADIYYTDYSIKKGQSIFNAVNILTEMIYK